LLVSVCAISDFQYCFSTETEELRQENERLRDLQTCKICMENVVDVTLIPCGHLVTCEICSRRITKCPVCRKKIKSTVKTFMQWM